MSKKDFRIRTFYDYECYRTIDLEVSNDLISINELRNNGFVKYFDKDYNSNEKFIGQGYGITVSSSEIKLLCIKKSDIQKYKIIVENYFENHSNSYYYYFPQDFSLFLVKFENNISAFQDPILFVNYKNSDMSDVKNHLIEALSVESELNNHQIRLRP